MKALYGFTPTLPAFVHKNPSAQVALLQRWGADTIFGGYTDPALVDEIHRQGMRIYAEFGCFQGQRWWDAVPASRPTLADGSLLDPIDWYRGVNPSNPTVRAQLLEQLATLVRDYAVDGVWLDFIRWPCRWESPTPRLLQSSFDEETLARFAADVGVDLGDVQEWHRQNTHHDYTNKHVAKWVQWRTQQITSWVAEARAVIDNIRPGITLGLCAIPWRQADFDGAIHTVMGQDFAALAQFIDIFSPMTYHRMCGQPVSWISDVTTEIAQLTGKPVCPFIQSVDQPTVLANSEYQAALRTAQTQADGAIIFTLAGMVEGDRLAATTQVWGEK